PRQAARRLVRLDPKQKPQDRARGARETDDDDRDIGQEEPGRDAARHRLSRRHELVTYAPDGLDLRVGAGELVAQLLHVYVHRARLAWIRETPDILEKAVAGQDYPRLPPERFEKLELLCAQRDRAVTDVHLVTRRIDACVSQYPRAAAARHPRRSPQDRAHAGDQLLGVERLGHVIIHTRLERFDLLTVLRTP